MRRERKRGGGGENKGMSKDDKEYGLIKIRRKGKSKDKQGVK